MTAKNANRNRCVRWPGRSSGLLFLLQAVALLALLVALPRRAEAVPSFARQTGLACSSCHINPPELTPLGRRFKLNGYTMTGIKVISAPPRKGTPGLQLLSYLPLSAWLEASTTGLNKAEPGTANWDYSLPQDVSLFLAGAFSAHAGSFIQATYDVQDDHFSWDNTDVRAKHAAGQQAVCLRYRL